jgi:aconitate hydratase
MSVVGQDSLKTRRTLAVDGKDYVYFSLEAASKAGLGDIARLPFSMKVLLENLLRYEDGRTVTLDDVKGAAGWLGNRGKTELEIAYRPARVLMQDFTGVPAVVDLAAMRDAVVALGGDPSKINPLSPVDLVIDHSVMVDYYGTPEALAKNTEVEFERNGERYAFLRWGQTAFNNFRVVPPGTGICHQVNCEYLARVVWTTKEGKDEIAYPDTLVGTDSHTTMVNGLAVLGWGVGGIEAEAAMLGQPISMLIPEVVGFKLTGEIKEGITATDVVLTVTQMLRKKGVVGKFVEFYGPGLNSLALSDRLTVANMAPEYGATCGFFPIDSETIRYLSFTGRDEAQIKLVEAYAKAQGMWRDANTPDPLFTDTLELDLGSVEPSLAGPKRPQDRVPLSKAKQGFAEALPTLQAGADIKTKHKLENAPGEIGHGDVVIAAITSCTNTSNPNVMVAAGLLAEKAVAKGLTRKPWVKTSLAPGSQVVEDYLTGSGLQKSLDALGFNIAGFGCTTCIGNSGPLDEPVAKAIDDNALVVSAVLSGNRNFEGRISPYVKANYLASPPLVVAYAIAGSMNIDLSTEPLGTGKDGKPVYLKDVWPTNEEVKAAISKYLSREMYAKRYANVFAGPKQWQAVKFPLGQTYKWDDRSTYVKNPPYFVGLTKEPPAGFSDILGARPLAILGDSITTDHISPAGNIKASTPAGQFLVKFQVRPADFNSYGARRGNDDVMTRGTFANVRIKNEMVPGVEGGVTKYKGKGDQIFIYDASVRYQAEGVPLVIIAGKEYGTGSSRDWAAKGTKLLGVKVVIAESFERIHRSNLVGMGILPLQFKDGMDRKSLKLDGTEIFDIAGLSAGIKPRQDVKVKITREDGSSQVIEVLGRIDTLDEVDYYRHGGILPYVLRSLVA